MPYPDQDLFRSLMQSSFCAPHVDTTCGDSANGIYKSITGVSANQGEDPFYKTINGQMIATVLFIAASSINLYVLYGQKEQKEQPKSNKNYSYLKSLPRVSALMLLGASAYFLYVAYLESGYKKTAPYYWTLFSNLLFIISTLIKTGVTFIAPTTEAEVLATES